MGADVYKRQDQNEVTGVDAELVHRSTCNAHQEAGLGVPDEDVVEVQPRDSSVPRGRTEADGHARPRRAGVHAWVPAHAYKIDWNRLDTGHIRGVSA